MIERISSGGRPGAPTAGVVPALALARPGAVTGRRYGARLAGGTARGGSAGRPLPPGQAGRA